MCASLASEICTGISRRAGVRAWLDKILEELWMVSRAREAWRLIETSQPVQMRVLRMIENQGREIAEVERAQIRRERLAKMEKVKEYWGRRRLEAQVEAGRGQI